MILSSAPGKLILAGEHAVVYGKPAIVAAIQLRTTANVEQNNDNSILVVNEKFQKNILIDYWKVATNDWERYFATRDTTILDKYHTKNCLLKLAVAAALQVVEHKSDKGFELKISTKLPIGAGLGSSASVAATVVAGVWERFEYSFSKDDLNKCVYSVERLMHGNPSGVDNTSVVHGGILRFVKDVESNSFSKQPLKMVGVLEQCFVIDSGKPTESTAEMVSAVKHRYEQNVDEYDEHMRQISVIVDGFQKDLERDVFEPKWLTRNEQILENIGVVGEKAKIIIRQIEELGGYAKVCGAGGVVSGSGVIVAYHSDSNLFREWLDSNNFKYFQDHLGGDGWKLEK